MQKGKDRIQQWISVGARGARDVKKLLQSVSEAQKSARAGDGVEIVSVWRLIADLLKERHGRINTVVFPMEPRLQDVDQK